MTPSEQRMKRLYGDQTPEQLRAASEQMGDVEFQAELAPYNNYTGGTPVAHAKYEGMYPGAGKFNTKGQFAGPQWTPEMIERDTQPYWNPVEGRYIKLAPIPDVVQALAGNATPNVWQHEFNHRNNPNRGEKTNRFADAIIAPDKRAWEAAVESHVDLERKRLPRHLWNTIDRGEVERKMLQRLQSEHAGHGEYGQPKFTVKDVYDEERARGAKTPESMQNTPWWRGWAGGREDIDYSNMRQNQTYWSEALRANPPPEEKSLWDKLKGTKPSPWKKVLKGEEGGG